MTQNFRNVSDMKALFKPFCSLVLVFCLNACFPAALPEYFSHFGQRDVYSRSILKRQKALVLVDPGKLYAPEKQKSYGSQFILAAFPLTYLYYPHGETSAAIEIILDRLRYFGFEPVVVPKKHFLTAQEIVQADLIIEPELNDLKLNAYDLIFYRKLSVKSSLQLKYYKSAKIFYQNNFDFSNSKYRANASAKGLAYYFERTLIENFDREFKNDLDRDIVLSARAKKVNFAKSNSGKLFIVQAAKLERINFQSIEPQLRASYGDLSLPNYNFPQFQRIFQRGFEKSLADNAFISLAEVKFLEASQINSSAWLVSAEFSSITIEEEQLKIQAKLGLSNKQGARNNFHCSYSSEIETSREGYLVFALEDAASRILSSIVNNTGEICRADET